MNITKFGPIIQPDMLPEDFDNSNINGPSVYRTPDFFHKSLDKYTMYFAHHKGKFLRLATASKITGPWRVLPDKVLPVEDFGCDHVASPDVLIYEDYIELYYHTGHEDRSPQKTYKAISTDGINFSDKQGPIGPFYWRNYIEGGNHLALAKYKNQSGISFYKSVDGSFNEIGKCIPKMRHCSLDDSHVYFSRIGDEPESIYRIEHGSTELELVLEPTEDFEIQDTIVRPSWPGSVVGERQVRDPFVFHDETGKYLFYTYRGEEGIALAKIDE